MKTIALFLHASFSDQPTYYTFDQLRRMLAEILSLNKLVRLDIDMFNGSGINSNELNLIANILLGKFNSIEVRNVCFRVLYDEYPSVC